MHLKPIMYQKDSSWACQKLTERRIKYLIKTISELRPKPRLVLDLGCGDGTLLANISAKQKVGIDLETTYVKRMRRINFLRADAMHLPFKPEVFDLVMATELLEHLNNPYLCIKTVKETLKSCGHFLASVPNDYLSILGKLLLLRFKSIRWTLREHKHHNLARGLRFFLGTPILDHSLLFNHILVWKKSAIVNG